MNEIELLTLALGLGTLAGVNLYLTVLLTGSAIHFNWLQLADQYQSLEVLGTPPVLVVAGALFAIEFFADKNPVGGLHLGLSPHTDSASRRSAYRDRRPRRNPPRTRCDRRAHGWRSSDGNAHEQGGFSASS